jgi:2,3-bisphosphoglycerate-dependent phosphoglycerate mutase
MTAWLAMSVHTSGKVPVVLHSGEGRLEEWAVINSPEAKNKCIPFTTAWQLNERMYGDLQGLNKAELVKKYGTDQVQKWRRSFDTAPPNGESLKMTSERTIPYFEGSIVQRLKEGKNVLVSAHGNSLRSIIMKLDNLSADQVVKLELATGVPIVYEFLDGKFYKSEINQS